MTNNQNKTKSLPQFVLQKAKAELSHTGQEIRQAKERIPSEYHDFLIMLPQNVKVNDSKYAVPSDAHDIGIFSYERGTYVSVEKPYVTVDGKLRIARDEHAAAGKKLNVLPPNFVTMGDRMIVSVTIESEIHGSTTGTIEVGNGGGVDLSNPFANAQTSAIGRALSFMGYGLLGTGAITSGEDTTSQSEVLPTNSVAGSTSKKPSTSANPPTDFRLKIVGDVFFNRDRSSTVPVLMSTKSSAVDLVIPSCHEHFAQTIRQDDVIEVKGWLNSQDKRLRVSDDMPFIEQNKAV